MKLSEIILILVIAFTVIISGIGYRNSGPFDDSTAFTVTESKEKIFNIIYNVENYPNVRSNLKQLEVVSYDFNMPTKWIEKYDKGFFREVSLVDYYEPDFFEINVDKSFWGVIGKIRYEIISEGSFTKVLIKPNISIDNIFIRGFWKVFRLEEFYLSKEVKMIRNGIVTDLLKKN